ncbi:MAG: CRISPR-associated endonuclease Cas3'', partial [Paracoccaceae bacterium]
MTAVGAFAAAFGAPAGISAAARFAGLLHDLGKYKASFQARLAGSNERIDHSTAGAAVVGHLAQGDDDAVIAELIAYAIAGHHAGLPDGNSADFACLTDRLKSFDESDIDPVWRREIAFAPQRLMPALDFGGKGDADALAFGLALLGRMIFSCLVDADFKDTEAFYCVVEGRAADRCWPTLASLPPELLPAFDRHMGRFGAPRGPVGRLRAEILAHVRARAGDAPGLFTLTVPTGGGKTLTSLGFALDHARAHGLRRIIYAIPFTSIIDQTAAIFRGVLGADAILEHHSPIEGDKPASRDASQADSTRAEKDKLRLAMEDWAAPVVVTTNVQLFESLFAARPSRCRKLRNIAKSVIVLDEAQRGGSVCLNTVRGGYKWIGRSFQAA